jgi:hypothetical protein
LSFVDERQFLTVIQLVLPLPESIVAAEPLHSVAAAAEPLHSVVDYAADSAAAGAAPTETS